jgi:hypothetical protein
VIGKQFGGRLSGLSPEFCASPGDLAATSFEIAKHKWQRAFTDEVR